MARCSICYTKIQPNEAAHTCADCQQEYHQVCWDELGGCGTYGCKSSAVAEKPPPPVIMRTGWGDSKTCPVCSREISSSLLLCPCGARFPYADPMTVADYGAWRAKEDEASGARKVLVVLFILTLLGLPAPLLGPIAGFYAWSKRELLGGANGTYLGVGYGAAAIGGTYLVLIGLLAAGW